MRSVKLLFLLAGVIGLGLFFLVRQFSPPMNPTEDPTETVRDDLLYVDPTQAEADRAAFTKAYQTEADKKHLRALYEEYLPKIGANGLIDIIQTESPLCHDEGHDLGKVIYAQLKNVGDALYTCHDSCASGCMHGVLMELFGASQTGANAEDHVLPEDVQKKIPTFCDSADVTEFYLPGDCAHGVGHAVMFLLNYNIDAAIASCDLFPTYPLRYYCATGAYMEYIITHEETDIHEKPLFYPCDTSPYPSACFRYKMPDLFQRLYQTGGTFFDLANLCLNLEGKNRLGCFHGVGNGNMTYVAHGQITLDKICGKETHDDIYVCIEGAMERIGKYYPEVVEKTCNVFDGWKKDLCLTSGNNKLYDLDKSFELYQR